MLAQSHRVLIMSVVQVRGRDMWAGRLVAPDDPQENPVRHGVALELGDTWLACMLMYPLIHKTLYLFDYPYILYIMY